MRVAVPAVWMVLPVFISGLLFSPFPGVASTHPVVAHLFTASGCPHCAEGRRFLAEMQERHPALHVREYEIWNNRPNFDLLLQLARTYGSEAISTPTLFLGDRMWSGFSPELGAEIEEAVRDCLQRGCTDPLSRLSGARAPPEERKAAPSRVTVPVLGTLDAEKVSLPLLTVILGLLDSFNPCAFFVLLFLLSLLVHARSRKMMLAVGGVFIFCSGLVYFLFMAAWLSLFRFAGELRLITVAAGAFAVAAGLINIKDFFFFQRGITLSIPEKVKPDLFKRMRDLVRTPRMSAVLPGTVLLALAANSYELLCTAGFPLVFTRILTLNRLPSWEYYAYLGVYNLVYILPLLGILLVFTFTLGAKKMTEEQGRALKLVSGAMMFLLGLVLLVDPTLLNRVEIAGGLLAAALLGSGGLIGVSRWRAGRGKR